MKRQFVVLALAFSAASTTAVAQQPPATAAPAASAAALPIPKPLRPTTRPFLT